MKNGFLHCPRNPIGQQRQSCRRQLRETGRRPDSRRRIRIADHGIHGNRGLMSKTASSPKWRKSETEAAKGACTVFRGASWTTRSTRVLERINALKGMKIDGVVATAPYYFTANQDEIHNYFVQIADKSAFPVYMYDLPGVTKAPIAVKTCETLMKHKNIKGIKSGKPCDRKASEPETLPDRLISAYCTADSTPSTSPITAASR